MLELSLQLFESVALFRVIRGCQQSVQLLTLKNKVVLYLQDNSCLFFFLFALSHGEGPVPAHSLIYPSLSASISHQSHLSCL